MNKLMGFFELRDSGLPAVPWKEFKENVEFDNRLLWTVRTAVDRGADLNLPRFVGVTAETAYNGALKLYSIFKGKGMIVYYPYFIALKSGTLCVSPQEIIIEAVDKDLWNLVTHNKKDVTIMIKDTGEPVFEGNDKFLSKDEIEGLKNYANKVRALFRDYMIEGKTVLLEWSFAHDTDSNREPAGEKYLVFYEIRTI